MFPPWGHLSSVIRLGLYPDQVGTSEESARVIYDGQVSMRALHEAKLAKQTSDERSRMVSIFHDLPLDT